MRQGPVERLDGMPFHFPSFLSLTTVDEEPGKERVDRRESIHKNGMICVFDTIVRCRCPGQGKLPFQARAKPEDDLAPLAIVTLEIGRVVNKNPINTKRWMIVYLKVEQYDRIRSTTEPAEFRIS
jgi:hypothetical protein